MAISRAHKRKQGIKGRTDLGVAANRTGVYQATEYERDKDGNVVKQTVHTIYRLRRITDGFTVDKALGHVGDGGVPDSARQALQKLLAKTITVYEDGEEHVLPLVFLDERLNGDKARMGRVGPYQVPVADDLVRRTMAALCGARDERIKGTARDWQSQVSEAQTVEAVARENVKQKRGQSAKETAA